MKSVIGNLVGVVSSNLVVTALGVLLSVMIPMLVDPVEYGYWQLFLLYTSYVGFALLGYCDGIYLKYGGSSYETVNKQQLSSQFYLLVLYLVLVATLGAFIVASVNTGAERRFALYGVVAYMILQSLNSFFLLLNQATARFRVYSIGIVAERVVFLVCTTIIMLAGIGSYYLIVTMSLVSKLCALVYNIIQCRDVAFARPVVYDRFGRDVLDNVRVGLPLTLTGVASMLMIGFGKFYIERRVGVAELGYYSLAYSAMAPVLQVVAAASIVFFPTLRNTNRNGVSVFERRAGALVDFLTPFVFLASYIVSYMIRTLLPAYYPSIEIMMLLIPLVIFQCKINVIYSNMYKVDRKERALLVISGVSLGICIVATIALFRYSSSPRSVAEATSLSFAAWYLLLKICYQRDRFRVTKEHGVLLIAGLTVATQWMVPALGFPSIALMSVGYYYLCKNDLIALIGCVRQLHASVSP